MADSSGAHIPFGWLISAGTTAATFVFGWLWQDQRRETRRVAERLEGQDARLDAHDDRIGTLEKHSPARDELRAELERMESRLGHRLDAVADHISRRLDSQEQRLYEGRGK
jgi:hypothetical protein